MNLRPTGVWGPQKVFGKDGAQIPAAERSLTLLLEGVVRNLPEIDGADYFALRERVGLFALQTPDRLPEAEKTEAIRQVLREFEVYRKAVDAALRERTSGWRSVVNLLLNELLTRLGIPPATPAAATLLNHISDLVTTTEVQAYSDELVAFLHPTDARGNEKDITSPLAKTDRSTANLNASGLRGGGSAVEHLEHIMDHGGQGYVVLFRLSCLEMIFERFGPEAVEDCLMAISAYLTHSLHSDDTIYHWSDSSLLAILQRRVNEQILSAELKRIAAHNRDITITVNGRTIMLRVPLDFDIYPINGFGGAEDLYKLSPEKLSIR